MRPNRSKKYLITICTTCILLVATTYSSCIIDKQNITPEEPERIFFAKNTTDYQVIIKAIFIKESEQVVSQSNISPGDSSVIAANGSFPFEWSENKDFPSSHSHFEGIVATRIEIRFDNSKILVAYPYDEIGIYDLENYRYDGNGTPNWVEAYTFIITEDHYNMAN